MYHLLKLVPLYNTEETIIMRVFLLFLGLYLFLQQSIFSQTAYTWNGSVSTSWSTPANWTPAGIPGITDDVTIGAVPRLCKLTTGTSVNNLALNGGVLDLNMDTLSITGATSGISMGTVQNGVLVIATAITAFGPSAVTMNCAVIVSSGTLSIRNTTFHDRVTITKTGSTSDNNNKGNLFYGTTTINNAGSGYLMLANGDPDIFYDSVTFNNTGSSNLYVSYNSANNVFEGVSTFNNLSTASGNIFISEYAAGTRFNNDIFLSSVNGNGVWFCRNSSGSVTFSAGVSVNIGSAGFSSGTLSLKQVTQMGTTPIHLAATHNAEIRLGPDADFGGPVTISAPNIFCSNSLFNDNVNLAKTSGVLSNASSGGNIFNGSLTVNYSASDGNGYLSFGNGSPDLYNGDVFSNNNSLDRIIFGHNSVNNRFNGNLIVTQTGSAKGTTLTWNYGATAEMAAGKTISIGSGGFDAGYFYLQGFTQNGAAPVTLVMTGSSSVYFGNGNSNNPSKIGGDLTISAPDIFVRGTTFNGKVWITKTGGTSNHNDGKQNIFNDDLTINQQSNTGYFMLGYNANDQFNGNIILSATGSGDINLGWQNGTGQPVLAPGKTISIGAAGFNSGRLLLGGFHQTGTEPINLNLTGTSSLLIQNTSSPTTFNGSFSVSAPDIFLKGGIFNNMATITKTGGTNNHNDGKQNVFNGPLTINQQSNTGYFMLGYQSNDIFNGDITVTSTGNGGINLGHLSGISACTLASGKTILVGSSGFSDGFLNLYNFTQLGNKPMNLNFTGTNTTLRFANNSAIGGALTINSPDIYFDGCTFNGTVDATKTGSRNNAGNGNNIFNEAANFTNVGSGYFMLGNNNADQFNDNTTFNNIGTSHIYVAYNSSNNLFNGITTFNNNPSANTLIYVSQYGRDTKFNENILVSSSNGQGIQFCTGNNTASATLAAGKTIQVSGTGFSAGTLLLKQFTQLGSTPQNLTLNGNASLVFGPSAEFNGNLTVKSPSLFLNGGKYMGLVQATKTGSANDASKGDNTFYQTATFINEGAGYLLLSNVSADAYNADVNFIKSNTGVIHPNYNAGSTYAGNVTLSSATSIVFGSAGGTAIFTGSGLQNIAVTPGTPEPVFKNLVINNTASGVFLNNTSIQVQNSLILASGVLHTNSSYLLTMLNNSTVAAGSAVSTSFINGPMRYQKSRSGSTVLNFPVGRNSDCRPVSLTVNHSSNTLYTYEAELFNTSPAALGYTLPLSVDSITKAHYYSIRRTDASGNNQPTAGLVGDQIIEVHFGTNDQITDGNRATIVKNTHLATTSWIDIGGIGAPSYAGGASLTGSITSNSSPSSFNSFSDFAVAYRKLAILPTGLIDVTASVKNDYVNLTWHTGNNPGKNYFNIERSQDGVNFELVQKIDAQIPGNSANSDLSYTGQDIQPYSGISYYRIKQTVYSGKYYYSEVIAVSMDRNKTSVAVYPNPSNGLFYLSKLVGSRLKAEWYDAAGRNISTQTISVQNGVAAFDTRFPDGIYFLKYTTDKSTSQIVRIIIRK